MPNIVDVDSIHKCNFPGCWQQDHSTQVRPELRHNRLMVVPACISKVRALTVVRWSWLQV